MIQKELENIVRNQRETNLPDPYIRNTLKEYLQVYLLYFIYTSATYRQNLIFTGGTCLRHFYGLQRLSEDLDFDYVSEFDAVVFSDALKHFFVSKYKYENVQISTKQKGQQVLLKFPVLKSLGLATENESDLLYVRIDLSKIPSAKYTALTTSKSSFGFNYAARHYDLPSLMAGKLHAILTRTVFKGMENRTAVKGRDYFDLLWFVKEGVTPNLDRLSDMLGEKIDWKELEKRMDERVEQFMAKHKRDFESDMAPLIRNPDVLKISLDHYEEEYDRYKGKIFH